MHHEPKLERGDFCHITGTLIRVEIETSPDPLRIDHVWFYVDAGQPVLLAVNTLSKLNRDAGFEARVNLGIIEERYETLPISGIELASGLDYRALDQTLKPAYHWMEREEMEMLLLEKGRASCLIECWGEVFIRKQFGLHQIHSRRASCAVEQDFIGRDGAIRFYYSDQRSELLLLKFCGQS